LSELYQNPSQVHSPVGSASAALLSSSGVSSANTS